MEPETADELGVSRNVVMGAYEQLAAEGFLLGISGAGTFVADGVQLVGRAALFFDPGHQSLIARVVRRTENGAAFVCRLRPLALTFPILVTVTVSTPF